MRKLHVMLVSLLLAITTIDVDARLFHWQTEDTTIVADTNQAKEPSKKRDSIAQTSSPDAEIDSQATYPENRPVFRVVFIVLASLTLVGGIWLVYKFWKRIKRRSH